MKTLVRIDEDFAGNVTGAVVSENGEESAIVLPPEQRFPRSELAARAPALAAAYGITLPAPKPAPAKTDSTPQGAD